MKSNMLKKHSRMSTATSSVRIMWYTTSHRHRTCTQVTHDVRQRLMQRMEKRNKRFLEGRRGI